jgi:predicted phosphohydrolase
MEVFGPRWADYHHRLVEHWVDQVDEDDLVLLPGDISWAKHLDEAAVDFEWIDSLPGTKVMIRGNHDYWWGSLNKMAHFLPSSIHAIHNTAFTWKGVSICGARLWDTPEYSFDDYIEFIPNQKIIKKKDIDPEKKAKEDERIFQRELQRLETSLQALDSEADLRIAMTHYPPISATLEDSRTSALLEKYKVDVCCFGHLHNTRLNLPMFGTKSGVRYVFVAADAIDFRPVKIDSN